MYLFIGNIKPTGNLKNRFTQMTTNITYIQAS